MNDSLSQSVRMSHRQPFQQEHQRPNEQPLLRYQDEENKLANLPSLRSQSEVPSYQRSDLSKFEPSNIANRLYSTQQSKGKLYFYQRGYVPLAAKAHLLLPKNRQENLYLVKRTFTLFSMQMLMMLCAASYCVQHKDMVDLVNDQNYLMMSVAIYLVTTIVLMGGIDLRASRAFPLNYTLLFCQMASLSFLTCMITVVSTQPYLVLCLIVMMLMTTLTYAIFGNLDCDYDNIEDEPGIHCGRPLIQSFAMIIAFVYLGYVMAPKHREDTMSFGGLPPKPIQPDWKYPVAMFTGIISVFGFIMIGLFELLIFRLQNGIYNENVSKHDYIFSTARISIDLLITILLILVILLLCVFLIFFAMMFGEGGGGDCGDGCFMGDSCGCFADCINQMFDSLINGWVNICSCGEPQTFEDVMDMHNANECCRLCCFPLLRLFF